MELQNYQAFLAVADAESFSRAAERLHLTQPAVSKRVSALEEALDARLFDRIGRRVILTEAGCALRPVARQVLEDVRESHRVIDNLRGAIGGSLPMVTSHHIGLRRLPDLLRQFSARYPEVQLDLAFRDSENACEAVERGEFELGVVTLPTRGHERLERTFLWDDPLVVAVARDHPLAGQHEVTVEMLRDQRAILPAAGTYTRSIIEASVLGRGDELNVTMETNYLETIRTMVAVGLGWSALPRTMIDEELVELPVSMPPIRRELGVVTSARRTLSNASKAMLALLTSSRERRGDQPKR